MRRGDLVLDLGAGAGALTAALARAGARVVAVERDPRLASRLRRRFAHADVAVVEADLLDFPLPRRPYRVVASIPFAITKPLLGRLLDSPRSHLRNAAVVVQWGAAKRFSHERPGDPRILWWTSRFDLRIARRLPPSSFSPAPSVDGAVLLMRRRPVAHVAPPQQAPLMGLLEHAFQGRRRSTAEALAPIFSRRQLRRLLRDLDIAPHEPIGLLGIEQWAKVNAAMVALVDPVRWPRHEARWSKGPRPIGRRGRGR